MSGFGFPTTTASSSTGFPFSAPATTPAPTFSFGAGAPAATGGTSFNFGAPTATTMTQGSAVAPTLNFGSNQTPSLGLATTATPAAAAAIPTLGGSAVPTFGAAPTAGVGGSGFSFGASPLTAASNAVQPQSIATAAAPAFTFGNVGATTTGSISLAAPKTTATALTLGTITTCTSSTVQPLGAIQTTGVSMPTVAASSTATPSVGLGGVGLTASQQKSEQRNDMIAVKENKVPQEILKTVDDLKSYIKQQKTISSEIARTSARKLSNVTNDIETLNHDLQEISDSIQNNYLQIKVLRKETSKTIQNVEMAKQTSETPSSLQFENTAPIRLFQELIQKYENDLMILRNQIELAEKQMKSITSPQPLSPDDLKRGLKQIHECFIALAGRFYDTHRRVENVKEQYMNLRSILTNETNDPFTDIDNEGQSELSSDILDLTKIGSGPSPFSTLAGMSLGKFVGASSNSGGGGSGGSGGGGSSGLQGGATGIGVGGGGIGIQSGGITGFGSSGIKPPTFGAATTLIGSAPFSGFGTTGLSGIGASMIGGGEEVGLNLQKPPSAKRNKQ